MFEELLCLTWEIEGWKEPEKETFSKNWSKSFQWRRKDSRQKRVDSEGLKQAAFVIWKGQGMGLLSKIVPGEFLNIIESEFKVIKTQEKVLNTFSWEEVDDIDGKRVNDWWLNLFWLWRDLNDLMMWNILIK